MTYGAPAHSSPPRPSGAVPVALAGITLALAIAAPVIAGRTHALFPFLILMLLGAVTLVAGIKARDRGASHFASTFSVVVGALGLLSVPAAFVLPLLRAAA